GIALARGRKAGEAPPPPPPVEVAAPAAPVGPPAPKLFPDGLPVTVGALPSGLASLSAQGCNACHWAAHDTWSGSAHANAWADETFQAALQGAGGSTACVSCHLPLSNQQDQLAAGYIDGDLTRPRLQPNPAFDLTLRGEGVTCAACHVRGETVIATRAAPNAPHPVAVSTELQDPATCATCHQLSWPEGDRPFYDTYGEWQASAYAKANVTCQDCHMAPTAGATVPGSDGTLPSHALGADPARALSALLQLPKAAVVRGQAVEVGLTLQNTGAGHAVPTGNPFKSYRVDVVLLDAAGKELAPAFSTTLARTVESKPPYKTTADTRLGPGAQRSFSHTFTPSVKGAAGRGHIEVRLVRGKEVLVLQRVMVSVT
ncbi:MAG: hypothetical protein ACK4YP_22675, partial [Myxococcota bacterium]